jgi:hypothetical protein
MEDVQVLTARDLLRQATTPSSLFALAAGYSPEAGVRSAGADPGRPDR